MGEPINDQDTTSASYHEPGTRHAWIWTVLLIAILAAGAYFRLVGLDWDEDQHLHPDERFMTMVVSSVSIPSGVGAYFDTSSSSLNPHNRGYGFYVYGTLPLILVRLAGEWLGKTGFGEIYLVGRVLSAAVDLLTVVMVYLITLRLTRRKWAGVLAAGFQAFSVLPVQLSHYFTVDTFTNFFTFLAFYFAVEIATAQPVSRPRLVRAGILDQDESTSSENARQPWLAWLTGSREHLGAYLLFGLALGLAVASKVSSAPLALALPAAALIYYDRLPPEERRRQQWILLRNLCLAAVASFLVFRICQPYAFSGPGFFGLAPNQRWLDNLKELSVQSNGDVDFPPALQWARRPLSFAWENLVLWGMGLPYGLLAWAGFLWMGWRLFHEKLSALALVWGWTAFYFVWQSLNFSRSMRYLMPIYPTLAIIAAWAVLRLWNGRETGPADGPRRSIAWKRITAGFVGGVALLSALAWAFAFTRIYTRPVTRVEASRWIYQNVPAAINLRIETGRGITNQPIGFRQIGEISADRPLVMAFIAERDGILFETGLTHAVAPIDDPNPGLKTILMFVARDLQARQVVGGGMVTNEFQDRNDPRGASYRASFDPGIPVKAGERYFLALELSEPESRVQLSGPIWMGISAGGEIYRQDLPEPVDALRKGQPFETSFTALDDGALREVHLPYVVDWTAEPGDKELRLTVGGPNGEATSLVTGAFLATGDPRGGAATFVLNPPLPVTKGQVYKLDLALPEGEGVIGIYGSRHAIESTWDDPLPLGLPGYNPYDFESGAFRSELNFEMYWDDNRQKLERFENILAQADYIFISSNRQWGTTVRVPERYPLTLAYYRSLIGCPPQKDVLWCYRVAEPGTFAGELGFDLIQVFESEPELGLFKFNTQFAEEAFSVYDHPKVFIFKKNASYDSNKVAMLLGSVDLSRVVHLTPRHAAENKGDLMLPPEMLAAQRAGGTWSELFNRQSLINRSEPLAVLLWYLVIALLGWMNYPLVRIVFRGLPDRGYPFARLAGMLVLAYLVWLAGSFSIAFNRLTISLVVILLAGVNAWLFWRERRDLIAEWKDHRAEWLKVEALFLGLFVLFLLVRLGNPDLWHPYKGGEKPMDFSYFNAILKSTFFPPFDPWFAGGYINYYYFGFVIAAVLVKWLGIVPAMAYNLLLPTFFAMLGVGAYSVGWNLLSGGKRDEPSREGEPLISRIRPATAGLASTVGLLLIGNLGTVRMIWNGFQRLVAPGNPEDFGYFQRWGYFFQGLGKFFEGQNLPYAPGDWYWIPSRAIPGEPITEFPLFTFLYADPHAHLFALPLTVMALAWALSVLMGRWQWGDSQGRGKGLSITIALAFGGLTIGVLRPANTWDLPTYLVLGCVALLYSAIRHAPVKIHEHLPHFSARLQRLSAGILAALALVALAFALYAPYAKWYGQGYNAIDLWEGGRTPVGSYLTHWGLFLFVLVSWLAWETRDWMAKTPLSALKPLARYRGLIFWLVFILVMVVIALVVYGVKTAWISVLLAAWCGVLILRPGQPDNRRAVLFMVGSALVLTLAVELVVLRGDIGRMNTVFKFYLQAWTLLAISSGAALAWLYPAVQEEWWPKWRAGWQIVMVMLLTGAALFTLTATADKIRDRMSDQAPHTLDGMAYMAFSTYNENGHEMHLDQDARAIQWVQDHVKGSPVIVEANTPEYRWGSRYTIYTGLPGVVGWNWHQRQQRAITPSEWVTQRVEAIGQFYTTATREDVLGFLEKYDVGYIVVGQLERALYTGPGIDKFEAWDGDLWQEVFRDGETVIYEVRE